MKIRETDPIEATAILISLLMSLAKNCGSTQNEILLESGVDISKYKFGHSTPLVLSLFKYGFKLGMEPAWILALASKHCQGKINEQQLTRMIQNWNNYTIAMDTALDLIVDNIMEN